MEPEAIESGLSREWLLPSGNGGYGSGRLSGARSRSYHGLLVAAWPAPRDRMLVLAQVDERIRDRAGRDWLLACHLYRDGTRHPRGDRHLEEAGRRGAAMFWRWRAGEVLIERRLELGPGNRGRLVWRLVEGAAAAIHLRPFLAFRSHHGGASPALVLAVAGPGARVRLGEAGPTLRFLADRGSWRVDPLRHEEILLLDEEARGLGGVEALDSPGELVWPAPTAGEELRLDFVLEDGLPDCPARPAPAAADSELERRLSRAMLDFLVFAPGDRRPGLIAGYPWFNEWARDTMIALPGLAAALGSADLPIAILLAWAERERDGLLPNRLAEDAGPALYNSADAPLWFLRVAARFARAGGGRRILPARVVGAMNAILEAYADGTEGGIFLDPDDGLLVAGDAASQLTWMDAKCGEEVMTPRHGKCVELQALYHEGLLEAVELELDAGRARLRRERAERLARSFRERFRGGPGGGLEDCVDGDRSLLRPNQLIALGGRRPLLERAERAAILAAIEAELLCPKGLRSLGRGEPGYCGRYRGGPAERDRAYHRGTVWAWLIGPWADARMAASDDPEGGRRRVEAGLAPLLGELDRGLEGQIGEIFDGEPPHAAVGAPAQAWSVAECLRVLRDHRLDAARLLRLAALSVAEASRIETSGPSFFQATRRTPAGE